MPCPSTLCAIGTAVAQALLQRKGGSNVGLPRACSVGKPVLLPGMAAASPKLKRLETDGICLASGPDVFP